MYIYCKIGIRFPSICSSMCLMFMEVSDAEREIAAVAHRCLGAPLLPDASSICNSTTNPLKAILLLPSYIASYNGLRHIFCLWVYSIVLLLSYVLGRSIVCGHSLSIKRISNKNLCPLLRGSLWWKIRLHAHFLKDMHSISYTFPFQSALVHIHC